MSRPVGNRRADGRLHAVPKTRLAAYAFGTELGSERMTTANPTTDSRTVFLVDDDSSTVDLYSRRLELAGFKTTSAFDAKQASEALPNLAADLIIVDLMLPKRSGFELLEAIRADSRHKTTPVLLLSNAYLPDITQKALKAGGNKALSRFQIGRAHF